MNTSENFKNDKATVSTVLFCRISQNIKNNNFRHRISLSKYCSQMGTLGINGLKHLLKHLFRRV